MYAFVFYRGVLFYVAQAVLELKITLPPRLRAVITVRHRTLLDDFFRNNAETLF